MLYHGNMNTTTNKTVSLIEDGVTLGQVTRPSTLWPPQPTKETTMDNSKIENGPRHKIGFGQCDCCEVDSVWLYAHPRKVQSLCETCLTAATPLPGEEGDKTDCQDGGRVL